MSPHAEIENPSSGSGGSSAAPTIKNLGNVSGTVKLNLEEATIFECVVTGNVKFVPEKEAVGGEASVWWTQDATGGHTVTWEGGENFSWAPGNTEPKWATGKGETNIAYLVSRDGTHIIGLSGVGIEGKTGPTGATGATGATGPTGPEGPAAGELKWEEPESLGANVENQGGEYAPLKYAVVGDNVYLTGVLKFKAAKTLGSTLFTLPAAAHPTNKKLIWVGNGNIVTAGVLVAVKPNGEVVTASELASTYVPTFDNVRFSKAH